MGAQNFHFVFKFSRMGVLNFKTLIFRQKIFLLVFPTFFDNQTFSLSLLHMFYFTLHDAQFVKKITGAIFPAVILFLL